MGKRILLGVLCIVVIIGCFAMNITKKVTTLKLTENEFVSMKYYVDDNNHKMYYSIPRELKDSSVKKILGALDGDILERGTEISTVKDSNRKIYMILDGKEAIIINNNKLDNNKYIVQFSEYSFLKLNKKYRYIMIDSENLKNIFSNLDNYFLDKRYINNKISI